MSAAPPPLTLTQVAAIGENKGPTLIAVSALFIAICTVTVALRFAARASRSMKFDWDDWMSAVSLVLVILYCVTCIISVPYGVGKHTWAADPTEVWRIMEIAYFNALIYFTTHFFIKISILLFYKRIFTLNVKWFKWCVYALGVYTVGWYIGCFFAAMLQCVPPSLFWERFKPDGDMSGVCAVDNPALVISSSALNTVGDVLIFALPLFMLWQLQLKKSHKYALILVFATGAFAVAAGCVRLDSSVQAIELDADTTWITADIYMWTAVEAGVGLICACLPVIGPLFGLVKDRVSSYIISRSSKRGLRASTSDEESKIGYKSASGRPSNVSSSRDSRSAPSVENVGMAHSSPVPRPTQSGAGARGIVRTDEYSCESRPRVEPSSPV
ncbi:uncharacterized protein B0I36DRAFT_324432 [Microdochium trichocladiopsis]|uniref:Rhodopsin domain-containing protein n=1 Tax=Microdochium trichocladiopsis TaxID=1682393 RepID=A0A9P8Y8K9_9PEZI|nr:uncharacterized protein B0I36DRAFT_324432 [Microdochium trichocladiopsis]KAH7031688.1 hypothetical protein B0I36DRAFT_324432 [Microdochium trichocladiopsis]